MHGRAVVPHDEIAQTPDMFVDELRLGGVLPQLFQERVGLGARIAFDIGIAPPTEIERGATVGGMAQDRRMPGAWCGHGIVGRCHALAQVAAGIVGAVMLDAPAFDPAAQSRRQCLAGGLHAAKPGVAAARRDFQRVEHGGVGRRVEIAHVGMPDRLACAQGADWIAFGVEHVGHDVDVGIAGRADAAALLVGGRVELTEAATEGKEIIVAERLATQQDHRMIGPGAFDRREIGVAQASQIDVANLRAHRLCHRAYGNGHVVLPFHWG